MKILNDKSMLPTVVHQHGDKFCIHSGINGKTRMNKEGEWVYEEVPTDNESFLFESEHEAVAFWQARPKDTLRFWSTEMGASA